MAPRCARPPVCRSGPARARMARAGLWAALAFTRGGEILITLAGHGGELLLGGLFLWRALTGVSVGTTSQTEPVDVTGSLEAYFVLINGQTADLPTTDVRMGLQTLEDVAANLIHHLQAIGGMGWQSLEIWLEQQRPI